MPSQIGRVVVTFSLGDRGAGDVSLLRTARGALYLVLHDSI